VRADRPVDVEWGASRKDCLLDPSGMSLRVQCATDAAGSLTVSATLTAEDGTQARVSQRIDLAAASPASMRVGLLALPEVNTGDTVQLRANVRYQGARVRAVLNLQQYAGRQRGWVTVATVRTGDDGLAQFRVRRDTPGTRIFRVQVRTAKGSGWQTSTSSSREIAVV
jgi:hypothetical protein